VLHRQLGSWAATVRAAAGSAVYGAAATQRRIPRSVAAVITPALLSRSVTRGGACVLGTCAATAAAKHCTQTTQL
jgi:hypothetical protein